MLSDSGKFFRKSVVLNEWVIIGKIWKLGFTVEVSCERSYEKCLLACLNYWKDY